MKFLSTVQLTKTLLEPGVTPYTGSYTLLSVNTNFFGLGLYVCYECLLLCDSERYAQHKYFILDYPTGNGG